MLGKWTANINTLFFRGDITFEVVENNGVYDVKYEIPEKFRGLEIHPYDIKADGNTLSGKATLPMLPGKEIEARAVFSENTFTGEVNIPFMKKKIKVSGTRAD